MEHSLEKQIARVIEMRELAQAIEHSEGMKWTFARKMLLRALEHVIKDYCFDYAEDDIEAIGTRLEIWQVYRPEEDFPVDEMVELPSERDSRLRGRNRHRRED